MDLYFQLIRLDRQRKNWIIYLCTSKVQVKELREELDRRKADSRGTKVLLVDRLFNLMLEESKQLAEAKSDAARALPMPMTRYCILRLIKLKSAGFDNQLHVTQKRML